MYIKTIIREIKEFRNRPEGPLESRIPNEVDAFHLVHHSITDSDAIVAIPA